MKILEIIELEKIKESEKASIIVKEIIDVLLAATNDWPNLVIKLEDYESEVRDFIMAETTKDKIYLSLSKIDFSKHAWEAESLSQLMDVFQFYDEGTSLKEIISDLRIKLENERLI